MKINSLYLPPCHPFTSFIFAPFKSHFTTLLQFYSLFFYFYYNCSHIYKSGAVSFFFICTPPPPPPLSFFSFPSLFFSFYLPPLLYLKLNTVPFRLNIYIYIFLLFWRAFPLYFSRIAIYFSWFYKFPPPPSSQQFKPVNPIPPLFC